jgi:hypothetical protein
MEVTFEFDGSAEQVHLCLQPCDAGPTDYLGGGGAGTWETRALSQVVPGAWACSLRLPAGWWRFRYYTEERGCLFYAPPAESHLLADGPDAMLHVSRTAGRHAGRDGAGIPSRFDQYICVVPEVDDVDTDEVGPLEAATVSPSTGDGRAEHRHAAAAPDARRDHRHGRGPATVDAREGAGFNGGQAEGLRRRCVAAGE